MKRIRRKNTRELILREFEKRHEAGMPPPTLREIASRLEMGYQNVQYHVNIMVEEDGTLQRAGDKRAARSVIIKE